MPDRYDVTRPWPETVTDSDVTECPADIRACPPWTYAYPVGDQRLVIGRTIAQLQKDHRHG